MVPKINETSIIILKHYSQWASLTIFLAISKVRKIDETKVQSYSKRLKNINIFLIASFFYNRTESKCIIYFE